MGKRGALGPQHHREGADVRHRAGQGDAGGHGRQYQCRPHHPAQQQQDNMARPITTRDQRCCQTQLVTVIRTAPALGQSHRGLL